MTTTLRGKDLILLLLYVPGATGHLLEPIRGRTALQKIVFLFEQELWPSFGRDSSVDSQLPLFEPFRFGPFSKSLQDDLDFLIGVGYVEVSREGGGQDHDNVRHVGILAEILDERPAPALETDYFLLTPRGKTYVEENLINRLRNTQKQALAEFKKHWAGMDLREMLQYVYEKYPKYAEKSEIRDRILGQNDPFR